MCLVEIMPLGLLERERSITAYKVFLHGRMVPDELIGPYCGRYPDKLVVGSGVVYEAKPSSFVALSYYGFHAFGDLKKAKVELASWRSGVIVQVELFGRSLIGRLRGYKDCICYASHQMVLTETVI